jgi:outer membrane lipoprotein-sorting protein
MKKLIIYSLLLIGTTVNAFAQKDVEAKKILSGVSAKYHAYNIVKSDFTIVIDDSQGGTTQTQNGTLIVQAKTNKYKMSLYSADPSPKSTIEQEITSDGKSQWTYLAKDKEVQLNNVDHSDESFNPAQMFTLYEKGFKYIYTGDQIEKGKTYQVIDLSPEDINKQFFKVRLLIDKVKKQIHSAQIFDKSGIKYIYTINTFTPNVPAPAGNFAYDAKAHPGIEVVDLR